MYNGQAFQLDLFELRAVDIAISNDMLCCLDALRWGRADLHTLIQDGDARVRAVIERWGLRWQVGMGVLALGLLTLAHDMLAGAIARAERRHDEAIAIWKPSTIVPLATVCTVPSDSRVSWYEPAGSDGAA